MINFTKSGCSRLRYPWRYTVNCRQTCREQTSGRRGAKGSKEGIIFCKPLFLFPGFSCRREQTKGDLRLPGYLSYPARESSLPGQRHSSHVGAKSALPMIQSGLKSSPDWPFDGQKEARIGLRLKISPNQAVFWQSDEIKCSHRSVLRADFGPGWVFG